MKDTHQNSDDSHSFLVEFSISSPNRGDALIRLLQELNNANLDHYRIVTDNRAASAREDEKAKPSAPAREDEKAKPSASAREDEKAKPSAPAREDEKAKPSAPAREDAKAKPSAPPKKPAPKPSEPNPLELRIRFFIETSKLIRININKGRGIKLSIPCRVLNYDADKQLITAYHVDEKQVYTVGLNEIDDFVE
ncbi:hypothetical protein [Cohnella sp.]|uniref:hypothetical protein n=1 Tax=Cohnella sp. TaxID=1883426 RepID=UPI0035619260